MPINKNIIQAKIKHVYNLQKIFDHTALVTFSERIIPKFTQKFTQIIKPAVSR
jgi:hypothetical protein